jgi:hypothetical protein
MWVDSIAGIQVAIVRDAVVKYGDPYSEYRRHIQEALA